MLMNADAADRKKDFHWTWTHFMRSLQTQHNRTSKLKPGAQQPKPKLKLDNKPPIKHTNTSNHSTKTLFHTQHIFPQLHESPPAPFTRHMVDPTLSRARRNFQAQTVCHSDSRRYFEYGQPTTSNVSHEKWTSTESSSNNQRQRWQRAGSPAISNKQSSLDSRNNGHNVDPWFGTSYIAAAAPATSSLWRQLHHLFDPARGDQERTQWIGDYLVQRLAGQQGQDKLPTVWMHQTGPRFPVYDPDPSKGSTWPSKSQCTALEYFETMAGNTSRWAPSFFDGIQSKIPYPQGEPQMGLATHSVSDRTRFFSARAPHPFESQW